MRPVPQSPLFRTHEVASDPQEVVVFGSVPVPSGRQASAINEVSRLRDYAPTNAGQLCPLESYFVGA